MSQQETFFDKEQNGHFVQVIKSYDASSAKVAFRAMYSALAFVGRYYDLQKKYDASGLSQASNPDYADLLWDQMEREARKDIKIQNDKLYKLVPNDFIDDQTKRACGERP